MASPPPPVPTPPTPQPQPGMAPPMPGGRVGAPPLPPPGAPVPAAKAAGAAPGGLVPPGKPGDKKPGEGNPEEELTPQLSFWQQPWAQNILPFVSSLAVHAGIVIMGLLAYAGAQAAGLINKVEEEQVIVAEAALTEEQVGGVQFQGLGGDPTRAAAQDEFTENTTPEGWADKPGPDTVPELAGGGEGASDTSVIGLSAAGGGFGKGTGLGTGTGEGRGSGAGRGGPLAPFGTPGGGGLGPKSRFMGVGGNARTVAFVCDASGSMINTFSALKQELTKAVTGLKAIQGFNIIFFQDEKSVQLDNNLVLATPENKRKAFNFLEDFSPSGTTDPVPGIELAMKNQPQLMYILTDADFPDNAKVLETVRRLNSTKKTKINTIAFVSGDEEISESFVNLMKQIAQENGGVFKHVREEDLQ